jgi:thymidylate synthase (FAD)
MSVKLISTSKSDSLSMEDLISYIARVSNPLNQFSFETSSKLLKYCIKNSHWSIFEHAFMTMEIKTSRGIAAQILRHRSFTFQEFSQRYAKVSTYVEYTARRQDGKNRQNSIDDMPEAAKNFFNQCQKSVWDYSFNLYEASITKGVAKEQARFLLPLNTETTLYMSGNVRSWIHYIQLRSANGTQKEHMDIASNCKVHFCKELPNIAEALGWQ